jgi:hypothetical protein
VVDKMFKFLKKAAQGVKFDRRVLRKNDISLLILDERWNSLFSATDKTPEIISCETRIKDLLKKQSRLNQELKDIGLIKKKCMNRILELTTEAFENNSKSAKNEMQSCEKEIIRINDRVQNIDKTLDNFPDMIKEVNLELLEFTVNLVYFKIRSNKKRVKELEVLINELKSKLKEYINEKESLSQDDSDTYSYFHDLLGAEELERLDKKFFGEDVS